jgi:hypothetical protein
MATAEGTTLPRFDELPKRNGLACSWGLWGERDTLGALNLITTERTLAGAAEVRTGERFPLDSVLGTPEPPLWGRPAFGHRYSDAGGFGGVERFRDDLLDGFNTQVSTQWDGFQHVLGAGLGHYNGLPSTEHSIHHWARRGIATRAVLVDIGRWRAAEGRPLDLGEPDWYDGDELLACIAAQGTTVEPGDILLIRTGWPEWWRGLSDEERAKRVAGPFNYPGIYPGERSAEVLWNLHVAAAATDTPALEMGPPSRVLPAYDAPTQGDEVEERAGRTILHVRLLVLLGIPIGELFELDALADSCAAAGSYGCLLTSAPINLPGAVGSPANALAIR